MSTVDEIKEFWNKRPCNIKHSPKEIGTLEYFEEVDWRRYFVEPHILRFAEFEKWKGKKVLEIGCGIGTDSVRFAQAGAILTLTDLSDRSIEIAKERFEVYGLPARFYVANAENLSGEIPVEPYDLIYSFGVIHHTESPEKVFDEIKKFCHKDTVIKIMLYAKYSWKSLSFFLTDGYKFGFNLGKTIRYFAEAQLNCPVANVYTKRSLRKLLKDFEIVSIRKDHIFPYVVKDYIEYKYTKTPVFKIMPEWLFKFLKKTFGWHYLIELRPKG
jgi:2-polyprenyl-3-methyl-5-hydroxy-6-metoxy-1,4-benzoquinol methylase